MPCWFMTLGASTTFIPPFWRHVLEFCAFSYPQNHVDCQSHMPLLHKGSTLRVTRTMSSISLYPHPSEEQSQTCAPSLSPAKCINGILKLLKAAVQVGGARHHHLGICGSGVYMLIVMNLYPFSLFFVAPQIIQQWWLLQCSGCIKISRDFRHCPKTTWRGGGGQTVFLSLSCGRSCGLGISWTPNFVSPQGRGDTSKLTFFLPFQCGWPLCGSWSAGITLHWTLSSHKDIFISGGFIKSVFLWKNKGGDLYFCHLIVYLSPSPCTHVTLSP